MRLTAKLTTGTGPEIEPIAFRADSVVFDEPQLAGLVNSVMTSQAEHPPALQPFSSKNTSCAERCVFQP